MFYSVNTTMKIAGNLKIPCICYESTEALDLTIKTLAKEGKVTVYDHKVFFANGELLPSIKERKATKKKQEHITKKEAKTSDF